MHTLPTPPPLCLSAFSTHQFYFSHTYDVTLTMQKIRTASSDHLTGPRWQRANPKVRGAQCAVRGVRCAVCGVLEREVVDDL